MESAGDVLPREGEEAGLWQDGADGVEVKAGFPFVVPGGGAGERKLVR